MFLTTFTELQNMALETINLSLGNLDHYMDYSVYNALKISLQNSRLGLGVKSI